MALNEACAKLEEVVNSYIFHKNEENNLKFREELVNFISRNDTLYTSVRILKKGATFDDVAGEVSSDGSRPISISLVGASDGAWIPAFTSAEQKNLGAGHELLETGIIWLLDYALSVNDVKGVSINPFGEQINLDRDSIRSLLRVANVEMDFEKKSE
ncbi:MAG: SseB family protein [Lachnospiraceae bacterium]|nr:SseB family protein [Lachnospiraceae bacterium]